MLVSEVATVAQISLARTRMLAGTYQILYQLANWNIKFPLTEKSYL